MTPVINFLEFKNQTTMPTLVLVGLHHNQDGNPHNVQAYRRALSNCRAVLDRARARNIPVAHARTITPKSASERLHYPPWISGFEPARSDMVFDVLQPSCYSNMEFSSAMDHSNGNFAIAGLFGETTCLSTAIDAHRRRHSLIYLSDASMCRNNGRIPAAIFHDAVSQVVSLYGQVMQAARWGLFLSSNSRVN
jgi:nicotinamidase-related amidase